MIACGTVYPQILQYSLSSLVNIPNSLTFTFLLLYLFNIADNFPSSSGKVYPVNLISFTKKAGSSSVPVLPS